MNFFRKNDTQLAQLSNDFLAIINVQYASLGLVLGQATAYGVLNTEFQTTLATALAGATRTRAAIAAKDAARKNLVDSAKQLSDFIIGNPNVSNAQLIELGLDPRTERVPTPPPSVAPTVKVLEVNGWTVKLSLSPETPENARGKPKGSTGISIFTHIGETAPASVDDWTFQGNSGKTVFSVAFDSALPPGTKVWFSANYYNARKQTGPAAQPVFTHLIAGGMALKLAA